MSRLFFVITHYTGAAQFGFGDVLLHTPLVGWAARVCGEPVDVGTIPEMEWIVERCRAAGSFTVVGSARDAWRAAAGRVCVMSDCSIDDYPYHEEGLSYTQLIARRMGIPDDGTLLPAPLYDTTPADRAEAHALLDRLGHRGGPLVTVNTRGRTRASAPGLTQAEYLQLLLALARGAGASVLIGDLAGGLVPAPLVSVSAPLPVWAALIEMSNLWVGECTGPYHLATALETPTAMFSASGMDNRAWTASRYSRAASWVFEGASGRPDRLASAVSRLAAAVRSMDQ